MIGNWKNIEELEECLTLEELELVVSTAREREDRLMKFYAAFKGVDLDKQQEKSNRFEEIERRAQARLTGKTVEDLEFEELGIEFEVA